MARAHACALHRLLACVPRGGAQRACGVCTWCTRCICARRGGAQRPRGTATSLASHFLGVHMVALARLIPTLQHSAHIICRCVCRSPRMQRRHPAPSVSPALPCSTTPQSKLIVHWLEQHGCCVAAAFVACQLAWASLPWPTHAKDTPAINHAQAHLLSRGLCKVDIAQASCMQSHPWSSAQAGVVACNRHLWAESGVLRGVGAQRNPCV